MNIKSIKRLFLKVIKPFSWFSLGFLIGASSIILWYCLCDTKLVRSNSYDPWQIAYYFFGICGSIGTCLAVVVALYKESFMKWLYSPKLEFSLVDKGVTEILGEDKNVLFANSYECYLAIENTGSLAALGCKVLINEIRYSKSKSKDTKIIKNIQRKPLNWIFSSVDIPVGIESKIKLFDIVNPNANGFPTEGEDKIPAKINLNGCLTELNKPKGGFWEIYYYVTCKNGDASKFCLTIEWNGEFKGRATEMLEILNTEIISL